MPVTAHWATLACHRPRLATLRAWTQVRNVARHFQRHHLAVGQDEIRRLPARPHKREPVLHTPHADRDNIRCAVKTDGLMV
eukprot:2238039-Alexandrium_andersonii.AAC.1